jgi:hypothetical protein
MIKLIKNSTFMITFIVISGCASTGNKSQISESCEHFSNTNQWGQNTQKEVKIINKNTSEVNSFYEQEPSKILSRIESIQLNNTKLKINIVNKGIFEEYSAPIVEKIRQVSYESHNFTGKFTPVGSIVWLFNPKLMNDYTFGCTENQKIGSEVDLTQKYKNGRSKWVSVQKENKIMISGFNKDYTFDVKDNSKNEIDLLSVLTKNDLNKDMKIKIQCLSCDLLNDDSKKIFYLNNDDLIEVKELLIKKLNYKEVKNTEINNLSIKKENIYKPTIIKYDQNGNQIK